MKAINKKAIDKRDLPIKICPVCNRQFSWRKKWKDNWHDVKYCSEKCRRNKIPGELPDQAGGSTNQVIRK